MNDALLDIHAEVLLHEVLLHESGSDHEYTQVMVGYVCVPNHIETELEQGLQFRNMLFIYLKPQLTSGKVQVLQLLPRLIWENLINDFKEDRNNCPWIWTPSKERIDLEVSHEYNKQ